MGVNSPQPPHLYFSSAVSGFSFLTPFTSLPSLHCFVFNLFLYGKEARGKHQSMAVLKYNSVTLSLSALLYSCHWLFPECSHLPQPERRTS